MKRGIARRRLLLAGGYTLLLAVLLGVLFDYYFDLNDDVLIKDIVAGIQTGTPSGYSIQMLYPISVFISLFYRIVKGVDWYGLFLCGCQFFSLFLIAYRSLELLEQRKQERAGILGLRCQWIKGAAAEWIGSIGLLLLEGLLTCGLFLWTLVYVQYTVTCGCLMAAAAFLLYTTPQEYSISQFLRANVVSILMMITAFCLRTEMFLLLLPFVGAAGLCKWLQEGLRAQMAKYGLVLGLLAGGIGLCFWGDRLAHRMPEWQEFQRIFDARTQIYDFYGLPSYEEHADFYTSIGLSQAQYALLKNYNYGVDESLSAEHFEQIEAYAKMVYQESKTAKERGKEALWNYRQRLFGTEEAPLNRIVILAYAAVVVVLLAGRRAGYLWQPLLLLLARNVSWFYIEYRGRVVSRITIPLYLMELLLLAGMLLQHCSAQADGQQAAERSAVLRYGRLAAALVLLLWSVLLIPAQMERVAAEAERRSEINAANEALQAYCKENSEHYYYVDVYSTVYFSEKMFEKVDNSKRNYDIIGGWACKSPLSQNEELRYLITDSERDVEWLKHFYEETKPDKAVVKIDSIAVKDAEQTVWEIYEITGSEKNNTH